MELNVEELKVWQYDARRALDREIEQQREELERKQHLNELLELTGELLSLVDRLHGELADEKTQRHVVEVKLAELRELSATCLNVVNVAGDYNDIHHNGSVAVDNH